MSATVTDDGTEIAYSVWGRRDGSPVLMIQGLGLDHRGWALQRGAFGRRAPLHRARQSRHRPLRRAARPVRPRPHGRRRGRGARRRGDRAGARRRRVDGRCHRADHRRDASGARAFAHAGVHRVPAPRMAPRAARGMGRCGERTRHARPDGRRHALDDRAADAPAVRRLRERARARARADQAARVRRPGRSDPRSQRRAALRACRR